MEIFNSIPGELLYPPAKPETSLSERIFSWSANGTTFPKGMQHRPRSTTVPTNKQQGTRVPACTKTLPKVLLFYYDFFDYF